MTQLRTGIYPGTFDPITNGHTDIIRRAVKIVDRLVIGVARNDGKGPLFATDERVEIVRDEIAHLDNGDAERIEVRAFDTLLMNFAQSVGARVIIRGLRAVSDFEYEFQMAGMNARLNPEIETVFLMASDRFQFISTPLPISRALRRCLPLLPGGGPRRRLRLKRPRHNKRRNITCFCDGSRS